MASIRFITAPIGGGKTLYSVIQICAELERTDRFIVTNVPLVLKIASEPERMSSLAELIARKVERHDRHQAFGYWTVQEYCQAFIKRPIDVQARLACLTEEQTLQFWRYLPWGKLTPELFEQEKQYGLDAFVNESSVRPSRGLILPNIAHKQYGSVPDFSFRQRYPVGTYYVLDEVHQLFPARFWQTSGPQVERYMSQLRKLNDDLDLVTQHPEKVDKNFRRNSTDWLQVENMGSKRLFMGVSLAKRFRFHWYNQSELPTRYEKPTASGWYKIDTGKRYEWLYKTAEGVGISGGIVAEQSRFKGRSPFIWIIAIIAAFALAWVFPRLIQGIVHKTVGGLLGGVQKGIQSAASDMIHTNAPTPSPLTVLPAAPPAPHAEVIRPVPFAGAGSLVGRVRPVSTPIESAPANLYCTGSFQFPDGSTVVYLSDGRTAYSDRDEVQDLGSRYVKVFHLPYAIPRR